MGAAQYWVETKSFKLKLSRAVSAIAEIEMLLTADEDNDNDVLTKRAIRDLRRMQDVLFDVAEQVRKVTGESYTIHQLQLLDKLGYKP